MYCFDCWCGLLCCCYLIGFGWLWLYLGLLVVDVCCLLGLVLHVFVGLGFRVFLPLFAHIVCVY